MSVEGQADPGGHAKCKGKGQWLVFQSWVEEQMEVEVACPELTGFVPPHAAASSL